MAPALLALVAGCGPTCEAGFLEGSDGNCYPYDAPPDDTAVDDTAPIGPIDLDWGDPITTLGSERISMAVEWMDAVILEGGALGVVVGQGGFAVISMDDASVLYQEEAERGYRVDLDGDVAWIATRQHGVFQLDLSDPEAPRRGPRFEVGAGYHEDISADDGRVLIGGQESGALFYDDTGRRLGQIPADYAFGVALDGDRALIADGAVLELWDVSDLADPQPLAQAPLPATGRDISWSGGRAAVALGGAGAIAFEVDDDALTEIGTFALPGSVFSVALDRELLWIGAWEVVGLAWLGEGGPVMLGHERPHQSAMGLTARGGKALVADWQNHTVMEAQVGLAGPELHLADRIWFSEGGGERQQVTLTNWGAFDLSLHFQDAPGFALSEVDFTIAPGDSAVLQIEALEGTDGVLAFTSDDPDEEEGQARLEFARSTLGQVHPDFELPGFVHPDTQTRPYRLSENRGRVTFLAYWTTW